MTNALPLNQSLSGGDYRDHRPKIRAMIRRREFKLAVARLLELYEDFPVDLDLVDDLATCYWNLQDPKSAHALLRLAAYHLKTNCVAWSKLAYMTLVMGDKAEARKYFEKALRLKPDDLMALTGLSRLKMYPPKSPRARQLRALVAGGKLSPREAALAHNLLGRIEEAYGNFDSAIEHFGKCKDVGEAPFQAEGLIDYVAQQKAKDFPIAPPDGAASGPRHVFVVGMPRSGTTLVESILCRHPDVLSVSEGPGLGKCLTAYRRAKDLPGLWDWVGTIGEDDRAQLQQAFLAHNQLDGALVNGKTVIDKTPLNAFDLGFAASVFPNARFIFMSRHPLNVGLSNFSTNFSDPLPYTRNFESIGQITRLVYESAQDYQAKLGDAFRWQSYEALVTDPEHQIRALLAHVGLGWDERCLSPEKRNSTVETASFLQVREKINTKGLDKWRKYEAQLEPLVTALGGWTWIEDWAAMDREAAKF